MLILPAVVTVPIAPDTDLDTIATVMVVFVLAAGIVWFLWRHK